MGKFGKKNHVNLNPLSYNICLLGESKVGKTTLIYNVCQQLTGEDGYIFLECGNERGADAIEGIVHENVPDWDTFEDICDDIISNKTKDYPELQTVVIDTYDQLITLAEAESVILWNRENPDKRTKSINAAWGGFGKGEKKAIELMFNKFAELRNVGVSTIIIGHVKTKDVNDVVTGETYQTLTSDQQQNYFNALKKNLHFLGLAYIDRTIAKEKTGKKNMVTKKEETVGKVKSEARKIKFRDDNFCVDSGSRFAEIVPEIDLDADDFIKALTDAIVNEQKKSGKSFEETKAEQEAEEKVHQKAIAEAEEANKVQKQLDDKIDAIKTFIDGNKSDLNMIKPLVALAKEKGYANPLVVSSVEDADAMLDLIHTLAQ